METQNIRSWMKANRHSSYSFAAELSEKHDLTVSPETVQRWMRGALVSDQYRKTVARVTKLKLPSS